MTRIITVRNLSKTRVVLSRLGTQVREKTNRRTFDIVRTATTATRQYINNRTHGTGKLAQSIKNTKKQNANTMSWVIYQDRTMTMRKGKNYALAVDGGYTPHIVSLKNNTNLQNWVRKNLGEDKLQEIQKHGNKMMVGLTTDWQPDGLQFSQFAYNNVKNNLYKIDEGVADAIKK